MLWQIVIAVVLVIPFIVLPAVFIWYLNIKGAREAIRRAREQRQTEKPELRREDSLRRPAGTGWEYIDVRLSSSGETEGYYLTTPTPSKKS